MSDEATQADKQLDAAPPPKPKLGLIDGFKRRRSPVETGFALIDAPDHGRWPGPRPRGIIWTLTLFALLGGVATVIGVFAVLGAGLVLHNDIEAMMFDGSMVALTFALLAAPFILHAQFRDRRSLAALGLRLRDIWRLPIWAGVGALLCAPAFVFMMIQYPSSTLLDVLRLTAFALPVFAVQTAAEEIVFRGWFLQTLGARHGARVGVGLSTLVFALLHFSYGASFGTMALYVALILPIGVSLALLALKQGSLWGAVGLHFGWNTLSFACVVPFALSTGADPWTLLLGSTITWEDVLKPDSLLSIGAVVMLFLLIWLYTRDVRARWSTTA